MKRALLMAYNTTTGRSDIVIRAGRLVGDDFIRTAIHTSLFTDRRAVGTELPDGETDRRGYWGDTLHGANHGSLLWTLRREKIDAALLERVQRLALEACRWLVQDGYLSTLNVIATRRHDTAITIRVQGRKTDGADFEQTEVYVNAA